MSTPHGTAGVPVARAGGVGASSRHRIPSDAQDSRRVADIVLAILGWALLVGFLGVTVVPGLMGHETFLGSELLAHYAPWRGSIPSSALTNVQLGDTIDSVTPSSHLISSLTRSGFFPQWDPYNSGGVELGALPNSALFSILSLPWWVLPAASAPAGIKVMETAAVALGMHLLLRRRWGLPRFTAPLSSLVFVSSGFMIAWTNWPQTRVAAMIPLLFWATDRLATNHEWKDVIPLGVVLSTMLFGGFPAVTAYSLYGAVPYFVVRLVATRPSWRVGLMSLVRSACGVFLALALSACQMLPFAWFATHYVNFDVRSADRGQHLPFVTLATAVVPNILGLPSGANSSWPLSFIEGFSYIGECTVVLVLAALLIQPVRAFPRAVLPFFTAFFLICLVVVYKGGLLLQAVDLLPGISTSPIGRMRSSIGFGAAVLAALGSSAVFESLSPREYWRRLAPVRPGPWAGFILRILTAAYIVVTLTLAVRAGIDYKSPDYSEKWILFSLLFIGVAAVAVLFAWVSPTAATAFFAVLIMLLATGIPSVTVAHRWWPLSSRDSFYPVTPTHEFLQKELGQSRYATIGQTMLPGTSSFYQIRALNGHGFTAPAWQALMRTVDPAYYITPTYSALSAKNATTSLDNPILDRLALKYVVQDPYAALPGTAGALAAPAGSGVLSSTSATLATPMFEGPALGIEFSVLGQTDLVQHPAALTATVVAADGSILSRTRMAMSGIEGQQDIALQMGQIREHEQWRVVLGLADSPATITAALDARGALVAAPVRASGNDLVVVHSGDATVIQRKNALDRLSWANEGIVATTDQARVNALASPSTPRTAVVLGSEVSDAPASTSTAGISVHDTNTDSVSATVTSTGPGWVVISDPMQANGWSATLDGRPVPLINADEAVVAVRVPTGGTHQLVIEYHAPMFAVGVVVTLATVAALLGVLVWWIVGAARRRTPQFERRRRNEVEVSGRADVVGPEHRVVEAAEQDHPRPTAEGGKG